MKIYPENKNVSSNKSKTSKKHPRAKLECFSYTTIILVVFIIIILVAVL